MSGSPIFWICVGVGVAIVIFFRMKTKPRDEGNQVCVGKYSRGLPNFAGEAVSVFCDVTAENLEFRKGTKGQIIGKIPRKSVKDISLVKESESNLVSIRWDDGDKAQHDTVFVFDYKKSEPDATAAAEALKTRIKSGAATSAA